MQIGGFLRRLVRSLKVAHDSTLQKRQVVRLPDLYSHRTAEESCEMTNRVLGFFRAYSRSVASDGTTEANQ